LLPMWRNYDWGLAILPPLTCAVLQLVGHLQRVPPRRDLGSDDVDQRREEEKADHVTEYGREDSGNHDGEHERFLDESDQAGVGVRSQSVSRGSSASQVRRSRSRVRSRSRSQARSRSWSRSRSRSRSGPTITISDLNNGRAEGESNGKDL